MVHSKLKNKQIIKLYDYQQIAFDKLVNALKKTFRALMVMATGLGKTIVSIEVVKYFITPKDTVLFLCHDNGILNKAFTEYQKFMGDKYTYAKFYGDDKNWESDKHNFVFATFQSMLAHLRNEKTKKKLFSRKHFTFIVVDESHHSQAETYAEVINYFKPKYKFGMTATPDREDQSDIRDIFGKEVVNISLAEAIAKNWLTKVDYKVLSDGLDEEKIRKVCKDVLDKNIRMTEKQINEKIFIKVRTEEQCKIIKTYSKKRKAIIFARSIEHSHHLFSILPSSVVIHSKQSQRTNDSNFELFEHGLVKHAIVVDKFNEGIDVPDTEILSFLRYTNSERVFLQQLGRGLRKLLGKEKVIILDFVANIDRIKQVAKLVREIEKFIPTKKKGSNGFGIPLHVEGKGFSFDFSNQVVNLLSVFEKIEKQDFYPTWQEAGIAAVKLGIKNSKGYRKKYTQDPKLRASLEQIYPDFPGFRIFLNRYYRTLFDAQRAAQLLGIKSVGEYNKRYRKDPMLNSAPDRFYKKDWINWESFLGTEKNYYKSIPLASKAAKKLGIVNRREYPKKRIKDLSLPPQPHMFYEGWSRWQDFLGTNKNYYSNWKKAGIAAKKIGVTSSKNYWKLRSSDSRLHSSPHQFYSDFPGWKKFLGKK